ncbi:hypothetical protein SLEP1_g58655 [Rubroshorea leprosula]|uniref:Uncharacterized protein n=1 Tax=Rubroshorea leprosula TaxID=152421 RepID=A0AAV5MSF3_9ROSI|nr:hypothetical protein SLEP1_g58655 [Rubroshorea leprosula]
MRKSSSSPTPHSPSLSAFSLSSPESSFQPATELPFHTQNLLDFLFPFHATLGFSLPSVSSFFLHADPRPRPSLPVAEQPAAISQKATGNHFLSPSPSPSPIVGSFLLISPSPTPFHIKVPGCNQSGSHHPHSPSRTTAAVPHHLRLASEQ